MNTDPAPSKSEHASVTFVPREGQQVRLEGVSPHLLGSPEMVAKLMDLLELPEGTDAQVAITTTNLIVR